MKSATKAAARGALLSIILRLFSFLLSQLTIRFVSASTLGQASIPLELLLGTSLFLGREGFRLGLTKETLSDNNDSTLKQKDDIISKRNREQRIINVSWISLPSSAFLSFCALLFHLYLCQTTDKDNGESLDYKVAGILYCLASFIESISEPLVIACLQRLDLATKAKAEGIALLLKGASCFGSFYATTLYETTIHTILKLFGVKLVDGTTFAVTAFGISQLVYATVFTFIMYHKAAVSRQGIPWPRKIESDNISNPYKNEADKWIGSSLTGNLDRHTLHLVVIFTLQGVFKHALTEADKIVLSALAGSYDQGVYALASSYGGLAARLLLQPLEENARLLFSKIGASIARNQCTNGKKKDDETNGYRNLVKDLETTYYFSLKGVLYIGLTFATIGTNYTSLLLRVLAGNRWGSNSEASDALSAFCIYTAFLALNGTTEAFVYGVTRSGKDVRQISLVQAVIGAVFALISPGLVRSRGAVGLVAANCICMGLRSAYSLHYARRYFARVHKHDHQFCGLRMMNRILPHPVVLVIYAASFQLTRTSMIQNFEIPITRGLNDWSLAAITHIAVGIACLVLIVAVLLYMEDDIRQIIFNTIGKSQRSIDVKSNIKQKTSLQEWYMTQMEKHELLTKSVTAGFFGIVGDVLAQTIEQQSGRNGSSTVSDIISLFSTLDKKRTLAMFGDGLFTGPLLHFIYELYDTVLPLPDEGEVALLPQNLYRKRLHLTIIHVLIDNTFMVLLYVFLTICSTAIFEGHYETIPEELRNNFFFAVKASWTSSIGLAPIQLLSFLYLPKKLKVLSVNIQDIAWVAVISYATHINRH